MKRSSLAAAAAVSLPTLLGGAAAHAHAIAGARVFPVTLAIDDPGVADEASLPTFTYQRLPNDPETGHAYQYNLSADTLSASPSISPSASTTATPSAPSSSAKP